MDNHCRKANHIPPISASSDPVPAGHRRRNDFDPGDAVPRRRHRSPERAQHPLSQHYPEPGHVEHDAAEIWDRTLAAAREMVDGRGRGGRHRRDRHHQPARDDRRLGQGERRAARYRAGLAGPPNRRALRRLFATRAMKPMVQPRDRACCSTPISARSKMEWMLANRPDGRGRGRPAGVRHDRQLAAVEADRRRGPCHRRQQRQPDDADGAGRRRMGRGTVRAIPRSILLSLAADRRLRRLIGETDPSLFGRADPDLRHGRRPAGGDDRPGLPQRRRHQGDLRHRRLRPDQQRRAGRSIRPTAC